MRILFRTNKWRWLIAAFLITIIPLSSLVLSAASAKRADSTQSVATTARAPVYQAGNFTFGSTQQLVPTLLTYGLEPEIKIDLFGNIYITNIEGAGGGGLDLFKSTDKGATFTFIGKPDGAGCPAAQQCVDGIGLGGGDDSIDVSSGGYLYVSSLWGGSDSMSTTMDGGFTWTVSPGASNVPVIDRQWIAAYGPETVYNGFAQIVGLDTPIIYVSKSTDAGKTYPQLVPVNDPTQIRNDRQGNLVVDQYNGNVYFAFIPQQYDDGTPLDLAAEHHTPAEVWFARSTDGGMTWALAKAYQGPAGSDTRHSFPITAIDRGGNLHVAFARCDVNPTTQARSNCQVWMTSSSDQGATWLDAVRVSNGANNNSAIFPWIVAGSPGVVDLTWYGTSASTPDVVGEWHLFFAQTRNAFSTNPTFEQVQAIPQVVHNQSVCFRGLDCDINGGNRSLAEYYSMTIDPDGNANIAFSDDVNDTFLDAGLASSWYTKQLSGASAYAPPAGPALATFGPNIPVGSPGGEPGIKADSHNCLFVTTPGHPWEWKSVDNGATFLAPVDPVATRARKAGDEDILPIPLANGSRPDLLYFADLGGLVLINIAASTDGGSTWFAPGPMGAAGQMDLATDRQWIAYDRNVPSAGNLTVYEMDHDAGAENIRFSALTNTSELSNDGVWSPAASGITSNEILIPPDSTFPNTNPGPVFVDPVTHKVYGVFTAATIKTNSANPPFGKLPNLWEAVGAAPLAAGAAPGPFTNIPVFKGVFDSPSALPSPAPSPNPAAKTYGTNTANDFPSAAIDAAGNIYVVWAMNNSRTDEYMVWFAASHDHGNTFLGPFQVSQGPGAAVMPWIAAGDAGRVNIVYYATTTPVDPNIAASSVGWNTMFAQSFNANSREPVFTISPVSHHIMHNGPICNQGILCGSGTRTLADFFQVAIGPDGLANIAYADNGPVPLPTGNPDISVAGTHAEFARQTSGPLALANPTFPTCLGTIPVAGVVSRKTHGGAGTFDINLPLTGTRGVECRGSGSVNNYTLVFKFPNLLTSVGGATVSAHNPTSGTGSVSSSMIDPSDHHNYIVNLTNVSTAQYLTVTLTSVNDGLNNVTDVVGPQMGVLVGDVTANGVVTNTDVGAVKAQVNPTVLVTQSNFRDDVTANGVVTNTDVGTTKAQVDPTHGLPSPP